MFLSILFSLVWPLVIGLGTVKAGELDLTAASKEGEVQWYTTMALPSATAVKAAFETRFPGITVEVVRKQNTVLQQLMLTERAAGKLRMDVHDGSVINSDYLVQRGFFKPYDVPNMRLLPEKFKKGMGLGAAFRGIVYVAAFNTKLVPGNKAPRSYPELARSGMQFMLDPRNADLWVAWEQIWGKEKTERFLKELLAAKPIPVEGDMLKGQLLASGEAPLAILYRKTAGILMMKGAPLSYRNDFSPLILSPQALSIGREAPHPNAALVFVDFLLSRDGQKILSDIGEEAILPLYAERDIIPIRSVRYQEFNYFVRKWRELLK